MAKSDLEDVDVTLIDGFVTYYVRCSHCGEEEEDIGLYDTSLQFSSSLYVDGWRVHRNKLYCPKCNRGIN